MEQILTSHLLWGAFSGAGLWILWIISYELSKISNALQAIFLQMRKEDKDEIQKT